MPARERTFFRVSVLTAFLSVWDFLLRACPPAHPAHSLPASYADEAPIRLGRCNEPNRHGPQPPWCSATRGKSRDMALYVIFRSERDRSDRRDPRAAPEPQTAEQSGSLRGAP